VSDFVAGKWYSATDELSHEFRLDLVSGDVAGPTFEDDFRGVKAMVRTAD
jgi:hypothetical protein